MPNNVTMDSGVGGDGNTYTDGVGNDTTLRGMDNGGHARWFIPLISAVIGVASYVKNTLVANAQAAATTAQTAATNALNAPGTLASSTTACTLATQTKVFTLNAAGKAYGLGQRVLLVSAANINNQMSGLVSIAPGAGSSMTVVIDWVNPTAPNPGSSFSDWQISLGANAGVSSVAGRSGAVTLATADLSDYAAKRLADQKFAVCMALLF